MTLERFQKSSPPPALIPFFPPTDVAGLVRKPIVRDSHAIDGVSQPRQILLGLQDEAAPCRVQGASLREGRRLLPFNLTSKPQVKLSGGAGLSAPRPQHSQLLLGSTEGPGPQ